MAGGEALAGLLRKGNAGSNTAKDHIIVLDMALAALPEHARPRPGEQPGTWEGPRLLARSDSAGATHAFAAACVERGVGFSFGFPVDTRIQRIVDAVPEPCWHTTIQTDRVDGNDLREGAWVAEATGMIDLTGWPEGSRLILRKERPLTGNFTTIDLIAATIGALNGALLARRPSHYRNYTIVGVLLMGLIGGITGGVTRDLLVNEVPAALTNPAYITLSLAAGIVGSLIAYKTGELFREGLFEFVTSASLAWFAIVGAQKGIQVGLPMIGVLAAGGRLWNLGPVRHRRHQRRATETVRTR